MKSGESGRLTKNAASCEENALRIRLKSDMLVSVRRRQDISFKYKPLEDASEELTTVCINVEVCPIDRICSDDISLILREDIWRHGGWDF